MNIGNNNTDNKNNKDNNSVHDNNTESNKNNSGDSNEKDNNSVDDNNTLHKDLLLYERKFAKVFKRNEGRVQGT